MRLHVEQWFKFHQVTLDQSISLSPTLSQRDVRKKRTGRDMGSLEDFFLKSD